MSVLSGVSPTHVSLAIQRDLLKGDPDVALLVVIGAIAVCADPLFEFLLLSARRDNGSPWTLACGTEKDALALANLDSLLVPQRVPDPLIVVQEPLSIVGDAHVPDDFALRIALQMFLVICEYEQENENDTNKRYQERTR